MKCACRLLAKIRSIATALRAPHTDAVLKRKAGVGMLIDMATRWGSIPRMVKRLIRLKPFVQDLGMRDVHLSEFEWGEVQRLSDLLDIPQKTTITGYDTDKYHDQPRTRPKLGAHPNQDQEKKDIEQENTITKSKTKTGSRKHKDYDQHQNRS